jgi:hypothetical protein
MQDKKNKNIKVRDLKPKKDAKGGMAANVSTNVGTNVSTSRVGTSNRGVNTGGNRGH